MAVTVTVGQRAVPGEEIAKPWRERIKQAKAARAPREPTWQMARALAAGRHHLKWSRSQRKLVLPKDRKGRERYTVEEIGQYRDSAVGELSHDDNFPTLLFRNTDVQSQEFTKEANDALSFALDEEIGADSIALDLKYLIVDLGTAAVRTCWDPSRGAVAGYLPLGSDGKPVTDEETLAQLEEGGRMPDGSLPKYQTVNEGCIRWELGAPENLLVPAGIEYQRDFPWEIWVSPVQKQDLIDEYGPIAEGLPEESLSALDTLGLRELGDDPENPAEAGRLRDAVLLYRCYERPTKANPKGQLVILAGSSELRPMTAPAPLPCRAPDGTYRSDITYFHYQRVPGRFWGRGLVEVLKDPQRMIDRRRSQMSETIDRGQPAVFVAKGKEPELDDESAGSPMAVVKLPNVPGSAPPVVYPGTGPGAWMQAEVDSCRQDMTRASGIQAVTLGENPANITTYSQLALLRESDQIKRAPLRNRYQGGVGELIENTVYYIRTYWGSRKLIQVAGGDADALLQASVFDATKLPAFFKVEIPKGAAKPMSQGAKLKLIEDVANYSVNSRQPLPVEWYYDSIKAGDVLALPEPPTDDQLEKAQFENMQLADGVLPEGDYFDSMPVHVPEHRHFQIQAKLAGRHDLVDLAEQHIQWHIAQQQANTAAITAQMPPPDDGLAGAPVPTGPQPLAPAGGAALPLPSQAPLPSAPTLGGQP